MKKKKKPEARFFGDTDEISKFHDEIHKLSEKGNKTEKEKKKRLEKLKAKRVYAIWGLTGFMGMLLCCFTIGLSEGAAIEFVPWELPGTTITGHTLDAVLSRVIVGSGTKPLHDLIGCQLSSASSLNLV